MYLILSMQAKLCSMYINELLVIQFELNRFQCEVSVSDEQSDRLQGQR